METKVMSYDTLIQSISQLSYAALFFALWLGIVGMPIPDEVIVLTGGAVSQAGLLLTFPAFIVTYLGVISGLSLGYVLGRFICARMFLLFLHALNRISTGKTAH
jgi:membrane-associated protein